jgi:hypothetical protein
MGVTFISAMEDPKGGPGRGVPEELPQGRPSCGVPPEISSIWSPEGYSPFSFPKVISRRVPPMGDPEVCCANGGAPRGVPKWGSTRWSSTGFP